MWAKNLTLTGSTAQSDRLIDEQVARLGVEHRGHLFRDVGVGKT